MVFLQRGSFSCRDAPAAEGSKDLENILYYVTKKSAKMRGWIIASLLILRHRSSHDGKHDSQQEGIRFKIFIGHMCYRCFGLLSCSDILDDESLKTVKNNTDSVNQYNIVQNG